MEIFSWHEGLGKWIEIANVSTVPVPLPFLRVHVVCRACKPRPRLHGVHKTLLLSKFWYILHSAIQTADMKVMGDGRW
jgi:hypothetical protein